MMAPLAKTRLSQRLTPAQVRENLAVRNLYDTAKRICTERNIRFEEMFAPGRKKDPPTHALHQFWAEIYEPNTRSYPWVGALSGHDHTTVMNGVKAHWTRMVRRVAA